MKRFPMLLAVVGCMSPMAAIRMPAEESGQSQTPDSVEIVVLPDEELIPTLYETARKLAEEGKHHEAFGKYLSVPGAEFAAASLARANVVDFIRITESPPAGALKPVTEVVTGELFLSLGEKNKALVCFQSAAASLAAAADDADGEIPRDYYPVDPPGKARESGQPMRPFEFGSGGHRDNWLIRRFIALEAWEDAEREFRRIMAIHRRNIEPPVAANPAPDRGSEADQDVPESNPGGFNGLGLQFALDFAYFLKQRNQPAAAYEVLLEVLLKIDLDKNPNLYAWHVHQEAGDQPPAVRIRQLSWALHPGKPSGISRKEFIRLAYGEFHSAGMEDELLQAVENAIAGGRNEARRILARILLHQGKPADALSLELEYIENAEFPAFSAIVRRARAYEEYQDLVQAAREYEVLLTSPRDTEINLPDPDEDLSEDRSELWTNMRMRYAGPFYEARGIRIDTLQRLMRIHASLGNTSKVLDYVLKELEMSSLENLRLLEAAAKRFEVVGKEQDFREWLKMKLPEAANPTIEANIHWMLRDYERCLGALADARPRSETERWPIAGWKHQFKSLGKDEFRFFLSIMVKMFPDDLESRLELMEIDGNFEGPDAIEILELLLNSDASFSFTRIRGEYFATKFRDYYDIAYRLMRLYQKSGQFDKLRGLGMRIANQEVPFADKPTDHDGYESMNQNNRNEYLNGCLALLIHHADDATLEALDQTWAAREDIPAYRQLKRRQRGTFEDAVAVEDAGWLNLPDGVRLIASTRTVLSLATDDHHVYAGHPWGVSVSKHDGTPVTKVALAEAVTALALGHGHVWAGTPGGLYRINLESREVGHMMLTDDISPGPDSFLMETQSLPHFRVGTHVFGLEVVGDELWIATERNVQSLHMPFMMLRTYSSDELGIDGTGRFQWFLHDGDYVWATSMDKGVIRYDRRNDSWTPVRREDRPVGLLGMVDGRLYGEAWLDDSLRYRPCIIDRETLEVTPILMGEDTPTNHRCVNNPLSLLGVHEGRLVFGKGGDSAHAYDETEGRLVYLGSRYDSDRDEFESILPHELWHGGVAWSKPITKDFLAGHAPHQERVPIHGLHHGKGTMIVESGGAKVLGRRDSYTPEYHRLGDDWPYRVPIWDRKDEVDGIFFSSRDDGALRTVERKNADEIPGNVVFSIFLDPASSRKWACTDFGVALLDENDRITGTFTKADGLLGNRIVSGTMIGDIPVFATAWGSYGGGLIVADPKTRVFTAFLQSDGLAMDKIEGVTEQDGHALVSYDVQVVPHNSQAARSFTDTVFDIVKGVPLSGGAIISNPEDHRKGFNHDHAIKNPSVRCPYLGGLLLNEMIHGDKAYLSGTRGLVVLTHGRRPEPQVEAIQLQVTVDPRITMQEEANRAPSVRSDDEFMRQIGSDNPYIRGRALWRANYLSTKNPTLYIPILREATRDSHPPNRLSAVKVLRLLEATESIPELTRLLQDEDAAVRDASALGLAEFGARPDLRVFADMMEKNRRNRSYMNVIPSLAKHADPEVFQLLLEFPANTGDNEYSQNLFGMLGDAMNSSEKSIQILLSARGEEDLGPSANWGTVRFAQEVFRHAGKPALPHLHAALKSEDRVVRSNAARGCGAIKDESSISHLIEALDLESGLSRASIVWALGELKAREALPILPKLYVDAINDEKRNMGAGYRWAQHSSVTGSHYDSLRSLDSIAGEWNELTHLQAPAVEDARKTDWLLNTTIVLDAMRKIGPQASQDFYRMLAGGKDVRAKMEAAECLAEGTGEDREKNLPILRHLRGEDYEALQIRAAVSLLILGDDSVKDMIKERIVVDDQRVSEALKQLSRVKDKSLMAFIAEDIAAIADGSAYENRVDQSLQRLAKELLE